jgi:predicted dehydrogenase
MKNDQTTGLFTNSKAAVVGVIMASAIKKAESQTPKPKVIPDFLRIGCLNVVSYSHLRVWASLINPRQGKKDIPFSNMRITHCWEMEYEKAQQFAKEYGCESVKNFDDMLGKVDCIIGGGYYDHPWNHMIHAPYLEAGLPNLINCPFANSLAKAQKMIDMSKKYNAPILVPSAVEWNSANLSAKQRASGKNIICYNATNSYDDYPTHGVHGVYLICKVKNPGIR